MSAGVIIRKIADRPPVDLPVVHSLRMTPSTHRGFHPPRQHFADGANGVPITAMNAGPSRANWIR